MRVVRTGRVSCRSTGQAVSQPFGRSSCGGIDLAELQIFDERLIDCDRVDGKPLEIREGRTVRNRIFEFRQIGQEYSELTIGKTCQNRFRSSTMCLDDRRYQQQA